jgi:ribose/xylose/arabinose/galactoside ABC-type transport system permease subunit
MAYDASQSRPVFQTAVGTLEGSSEATRDVGVWQWSGGDESTDAQPDRLGVHGIWELLLALLATLTAATVHQVNSDALLGAGLEAFLLLAASLGLAAVGMGWSVRSAVPNLAVGPIALGAAMFFAQQAEGGLWFGVGVTLAAATAAGVLLSLLVIGLQVPAWAGSLGLAMGAAAWLSAGRTTGLPEEITYRPADHAVYWFVGFAAVSLLGGLLGLGGPARRVIGGFRPTGDPSQRPGFVPGLTALAALVGSCLLAAAAGILMALISRGATPDPGIALTGLALGAVLVGGTSGYGRRGGVSGTLLGVVLLSLVLRLAAEQEWRFPPLGYAAVAVVVGLLVTRLVEVAGRPRATAAAEMPEWVRPDAVAAQAPAVPRAPLALPAGSSAQPVVQGEVLEDSGQTRATARSDAAGSARSGNAPVTGQAAAGRAGPPLRGRIGDRAERLSNRTTGAAGTGQPTAPGPH